MFRAQMRDDHRTNMDLHCNRYYKLNRIFLLPFGLWPYGSRKLKPIQAIFFISLLVSSVVTQLMKIVTTKYDLDFILTDLSFTIPSVIYVLKYNTFYIQAKRLKRLLELIYDDWNSLTSEEEVHIIRKYTITGRRYTVALALLIYPASICFILYQFAPNFLDFVAPLNESRPRQHPFLAEYFVDEQKYFNIILMHMIAVIIVGISTFLGTETIFLVFIHHTCGMFKIVSYRIKHALDENAMRNSTAEWNVCVHARIVAAVEIHQRAIQFFDYFSMTLRLPNFILLSLGIASLSINLFRAAMLPVNRQDAALLVLFVFCHLYYMFLGNYAGQKIIDHSIGIFNEMQLTLSCLLKREFSFGIFSSSNKNSLNFVNNLRYNIPWYKISVRSQKLLLFVMQRSMQNCKLVLGGIFCISLEGFTTISSMSMSYFTVLSSTR